MVKQLFFIFLLALVACQSEHANEPSAEEEVGILRFFEKFPEIQFMEIRLGESTHGMSEHLTKKGFEKKEDVSVWLLNEKEGVEIIMPNEEKINSMKVFINNENDIQESKRLVDFLRQKATSSKVSADFSFFEFENSNQYFSLTLFEQPEFIRLSYQLKTAH